jgi:hypothetical protein
MDQLISRTAGSPHTNNSCAIAVASWPSLPVLDDFVTLRIMTINPYRTNVENRVSS